MDIRDEIKRCLAALPRLAAESDSKQIKADIDMLMGAALQLTMELANRNADLAKRCQSRKAKRSTAAPISGAKQPARLQSNTDSANSERGAEGRSKELSAIQQGIRQADPTTTDQQRMLRGKVYGAENDDVEFRNAAKAIAR